MGDERLLDNRGWACASAYRPAPIVQIDLWIA